MSNKFYSTRSAAVRAAREACRRALSAPAYEAAEGHDYVIHPMGYLDALNAPVCYLGTGTYAGPSRFELRGPSAEAQQE